MKSEFPRNIKEAKEYKKIIRSRLKIFDHFDNIAVLCALDVAYTKERSFAAGVVYDINKKTIIEVKTLDDETRFPYIPTFLFMREVPILLSILANLESNVDLCLVDGHGIAHPQNTGSASVLGVIAEIPTIGIAKKPLRFFKYQPTQKNNIDQIILKEEHVGYRYRFERRWNPIYISPGNMISCKTSLSIIENLLTSRYKLPIPLQEAHVRAGLSKNK